MKNPKAKSIRSRSKSHGATAAEILTAPIASQIPRKWQWHYKTLLKLRERLLGERRQRTDEVSERIESHSMSIADSATDEFDHELALAELSSDQNALFEIDEAVKRIQNGTYGRCEESGKLIAAGRLRAIPWARFCKEVEERLEKKGILTRPHLGSLHSVREGAGEELEETTDEVEAKEAELERPKQLIEKVVSEPPKPVEASDAQPE